MTEQKKEGKLIAFEKQQDIRIIVESDNPVDDHALHHFTVDASYLRPAIKANIKSVLRLNINPDEPYENRRLQAMMNATLKGLLTMSGDSILKALHPGRTDYPKPGRKDDIIEWYLTFAVDKLVDFLVNNAIVFTGEKSDDSTSSTRLTKVRTESVTAAQSREDSPA